MSNGDLRPETVDKVVSIFHPVQIVALNVNSRHVHLTGDWRKDLSKLEGKKGHITGARTTLKVLNELVVEGVINLEDPLYVYFVGGTLKTLVYGAQQNESRDRDSQPISSTKTRASRSLRK